MWGRRRNRRPCLGGQPGQRGGEQCDAVPFVVGHPSTGSVGEAQPGGAAVSRDTFAVQQSGCHQVPDERAHRVGRRVQAGGGVLHADPRVGADQQEQLDLGLRQRDPVAVLARRAAQPAMQFPDDGAQRRRRGVVGARHRLGRRVLGRHRVAHLTSERL